MLLPIAINLNYGRLLRPVIEKITALLSQRSRFVKVKKQLSTAAAEQALFMHKDITKSIQKYTDKTVQAIDKQIRSG